MLLFALLIAHAQEPAEDEQEPVDLPYVQEEAQQKLGELEDLLSAIEAAEAAAEDAEDADAAEEGAEEADISEAVADPVSGQIEDILLPEAYENIAPQDTLVETPEEPSVEE